MAVPLEGKENRKAKGFPYDKHKQGKHQCQGSVRIPGKFGNYQRAQLREIVFGYDACWLS